MEVDTPSGGAHPKGVARIFWVILIALSLAGSPGPAFAAPSIGCSMAGADMGMAPDHDTMDCCTPDCATPCPAAVLPLGDLAVPADDYGAVRAMRPHMNALPSVNPAAADPPPRV